ncbi:GreA/GreB family elongation factor [Cohnella cholangitidis]|uniref:GreA/GreB family elongation factor n=2 Tax=Cohnella cholangitidis TaxID=2598458 RepID=A0A7G5BVG3_9BACL|nr:GreA/GreB family elongation factor [Cohnella cholangitidis]
MYPPEKRGNLCMSHSDNAKFQEELIAQENYFEQETSELLRKLYPDTGKRDELQKLLDRYMDHIRLVLEGSLQGETDTLVWIGSDVTVVDEIEGFEETYKIVLPQRIDADLGHISFMSPLGSKLLLARQGDRVEVDSPSGSYGMIISKVMFG